MDHSELPFVRRFPFTQPPRQFVEDHEWSRMVREAELRGVFADFPPGHFGEALELGCGDGEASRILSFYCRHLTATDFDGTKIRCQSGAEIGYRTADAQDLREFASDSMDLVFSSNMIMHLPAPMRCLQEVGRVVKPGGLVVLTTPNRTWKLLHLLLFYPSLAAVLTRRLLGRRGQAKQATGAGAVLDDNLRARKEPRSRRHLLLLPPCGAALSHWVEFQQCHDPWWTTRFAQAGLRLEGITRLPFYHPYGCRFRWLLRAGRWAGLSSCTAFHLRKS